MYKYIATDGFLSTLDNSKPSLFFDIDHTVIYPLDKKRMYSSKNKYGWEPDPNAKSTLQRAISQGFTVYFITNQLKYDSIIENRLREMLRYLEIEALILIADQRNHYRKPSAGLIQNPDIPGGLPTIDLELSFHCGDAAGRVNDFSDDDLWFARSAGINFYLPDEIFGRSSRDYPSFDFTIRRPLQPIPKSPPIDQTLIKTLKEYYESSDGIMLMGLPGTGKSTIRKWCIENLKGRKIYVYNNDEDLMTPKDIPKDKKSNAFYIFDNTNLTEAHRKRFTETLNLKLIFIDLTAKDAIRGVKYRNIFEGGAHIPDVAINTMNARKEIPVKIDLHLKHRPVLYDDFPAYLN